MKKDELGKINIREMTDTDLSKVQLLWKEVGFNLSFSDTIPELKKMLKHNPNLCLVLELSNGERKIIGAVLGGFDGRRGWIHHLAINPLYQNKGIGMKIMNELTQRFENMGIAKLKLEILVINEKVIEFYKKLGWDLRKDLTTMSLTLKS
jgi:ribosomal protein S18 acetylase RimI-like enzyme